MKVSYSFGSVLYVSIIRSTGDFVRGAFVLGLCPGIMSWILTFLAQPVDPANAKHVMYE